MRNAFQTIAPQQVTKLASHLKGLVETRLWAKIILGMLLGVLVGLMFGPSTGWFDQERSSVWVDWLALPGRVFLVLLQMIVVPLVFARSFGALRQAEVLRTFEP